MPKPVFERKMNFVSLLLSFLSMSWSGLNKQNNQQMNQEQNKRFAPEILSKPTTQQSHLRFVFVPQKWEHSHPWAVVRSLMSSFSPFTLTNWPSFASNHVFFWASSPTTIAIWSMSFCERNDQKKKKKNATKKKHLCSQLQSFPHWSESDDSTDLTPIVEHSVWKKKMISKKKQNGSFSPESGTEHRRLSVGTKLAFTEQTKLLKSHPLSVQTHLTTNRSNLGFESHVQHFVCFVQTQKPNLRDCHQWITQTRGPTHIDWAQIFLLQKVNYSSGRSHHDFAHFAQGCDLRHGSCSSKHVDHVEIERTNPMFFELIRILFCTLSHHSRHWSKICLANSRVGATTIAYGEPCSDEKKRKKKHPYKPLSFGAGQLHKWWMTGQRNAPVLPDPVFGEAFSDPQTGKKKKQITFAIPMISFPDKAAVTVWAWMAVGAANCFCSSVVNVRFNPRPI